MIGCKSTPRVTVVDYGPGERPPARVSTAQSTGAARSEAARFDVVRVGVLLDQAKSEASVGNFDAALALFEQAIAENPKLLDAYLSMGDIHRNRGDYEKAADQYEKATMVAPTSFDAHYYLGLMRQLLREFAKAVRAYLYALAIDPKNFNANNNLAGCYMQMGRYAEALPYARTAAEIQPKNQGAWANLAAAYSLMNLHDKSVRAYRQAMELGEAQEPILLGLAEAHNRLGHYDRAIAVLETAMEKFPSAVAHERMGYAYFKKRNYDEALVNFRAALMFEPNDPAALNGLGVCMMTKYIQSDRRTPIHRDEALRAWRRSMELTPNQPRIDSLVMQFARL